jgi:hypothetical protein
MKPPGPSAKTIREAGPLRKDPTCKLALAWIRPNKRCPEASSERVGVAADTG